MFTVATIMDSFKKYFSYGRMICGCGITDVKFMGTLQDYELILDHLKSLEEFVVVPENTPEHKIFDVISKDKLHIYIEKMKYIVNNFIETYNGNVNLSFWNTVAATEIERIGSGGETQTNLNGWITHFIGIYKKCSLDSIPSRHIAVPIKIENEFTGTSKSMLLQAGFCGISYNDGFYKPVLGMTIYHYQKEEQTDEDGFNGSDY